MKNKVIIIGGDHSNALGVIRAFGENGIKPYLFVISPTRFVAIKKSKYIEKYWICKDEEEAILKINSYFNNEKEKPVIIPTSDSAAAILDCNYINLSKKFILQNMNEKSGCIINYMDKFEQYKFGTKHNLNMAKSKILYAPFDLSTNYLNFEYPIIIKPLLSIDGKKEDISIVKNEEEFKEKLVFYNKNGYIRLMIQELIDFDYECDMSGFAYNKSISISGFVQKHRIWPLKRGSLTFGQVKKYEIFEEEISKIKNIITDLGYTGLFDVEFFVKGNKFYLNEINFRNSGLTYLYKNAYLCYYYYLSCVKNEFVSSPEIDNEYYVMDEQAEIHQIIDKNISIRTHIKDKKRSEILLAENKNDPKPARYLLFYKLLNNLKLKNILYILEKIYHKSPESILLKMEKKDVVEDKKNISYDVIEITSDNVEQLCDNEENTREFKQTFKNDNIKGLILKDGEEFVARGIVKSYGAKDRFIKIINKKSYLFCNMFVNPKYRGKNIQYEVLKCLTKKFIHESNCQLYSVVYSYNIPSKKNLEKFGLREVKRFTIRRFLKHSIGKEKI